MEKATPPIKGKMFLHGQVTACSPLHIGSGERERSEMDILLDQQGQPYIPATSLIGVLLHTVRDTLELDEEYQKRKNKFWGYSKDDDGHQSSFRCSDLRIQGKYSVVNRDGVAIEHASGLAKDQSKYDYEIVDTGARFALDMEFNYFEDDEEFVRRMAVTIYDLLTTKQIRLGKKTNSGLGEMRFHGGLYVLNFTHADDIACWLFASEKKEQWFHEALSDKKLNEDTLKAALETCYKGRQDSFCIDAALFLKNSLIIRSYSNDPKLPDALHITSGGKPVLTGPSLKGALRARAERIVKTLGKEQSSIMTDLFGQVPENGSTRAQKSRLRVNEVRLPNYHSALQTRIRIDRFTGGTVEGALFDTMPVFDTEQQDIRHVQIVVERCKAHEAGLILLVLKDLWSGDLAIGGEKNIGRGSFQGVEAQLTWKEQQPILLKDPAQLSSDEKTRLQSYVDALTRFLEEKHDEC